jgi:hypothetical protein
MNQLGTVDFYDDDDGSQLSYLPEKETFPGRTRGEIKARAREWADVTLDEGWTGAFPVNPFDVASYYGVSFTVGAIPRQLSADFIAREFPSKRNPNERIVGYIFREKSGEVRIFIDELSSPPRQRMTCAHELGHYVEQTRERRQGDEGFAFVDLGMPRWAPVMRERYTSEIFADEYALALLMPTQHMRDLMARDVPVLDMAKQLNVSHHSLIGRLYSII